MSTYASASLPASEGAPSDAPSEESPSDAPSPTEGAGMPREVLAEVLDFFGEAARFPGVVARYEEAAAADPAGRDARVLCAARVFRRMVVRRVREFARLCRPGLRRALLTCELEPQFRRPPDDPDLQPLVDAARELLHYDVNGGGPLGDFEDLYLLFDPESALEAHGALVGRGARGDAA